MARGAFFPHRLLGFCVLVALLFQRQNAQCQDSSNLNATAMSKYADIVNDPKTAVVLRNMKEQIPLWVIANACAPILWFSPDEPLLLDPDKIPSPLPFMPNNHRAVVYYYLNHAEIEVWDSAGALVGWQTSFVDSIDASTIMPMRKVDKMEITYVFNYAWDTGHKNDIEKINVELTREGANLRISRVIGFAHGVRWWTNILNLDKEGHYPKIVDGEYKNVNLPITVLIEEGKHASCPDRNGDGFYSPGFDTNVALHDAWGVRDNIRGGVIQPAYGTWMTKPRQCEGRVLPPSVAAADSSSYELTFISASMYKDLSDPDLKNRLDSNHVGRQAKQRGFFSSLLDPFSVFYRYDRGSMFGYVFPLPFFEPFTETGAELPVVGGYLCLKGEMAVNYDQASESKKYEPMWDGALCFSSSRSRWLDYYLATGVEKSNLLDVEMLLEGGMKLRLVNPEWRVIHYFGMRFGIKTLVHDWQPSETRFIAELGTALY